MEAGSGKIHFLSSPIKESIMERVVTSLYHHTPLPVWYLTEMGDHLDSTPGIQGARMTEDTRRITMKEDQHVYGSTIARLPACPGVGAVDSRRRFGGSIKRCNGRGPCQHGLPAHTGERGVCRYTAGN